jgi:ubiquinone biosynthesis accessory factor UbiJ
MMNPFGAALVAPLNHLLAQAPWAQERLAPFAGKTARFSVFPFDYRVTVTADGLVMPASGDYLPDTTITLPLAVAMRFMAGDETARQQAHIEGDTAFAQEIAYLSQHLRWDFEEDLSKVFGDVFAHRVGQTVGGLSSWATGASANLAENVRDYWVQEQPLVASREAVQQFNQEVDQLRDDVERLEKRIKKLSPDSF